MKHLILVLAVVSVLFVACGEPIDGSGGDILSDYEVVPNVYFPSGENDYTLESVHVSSSGSYSTYMYMIMKVTYTGSQELSSVRFSLQYYDNDDLLIYESSSYVDNPVLRNTGTSNTNSYASPSARVLYVNDIEDMADHGADITDIA